MTYHPDGGNSPNDPNYRNNPNPPVYMRDRPGLGSAAWAGIALLALLVIGVVMYALNRDDENVATTSPAATTGQRTDAPKPTTERDRTPAPSPAPKAQ